MSIGPKSRLEKRAVEMHCAGCGANLTARVQDVNAFGVVPTSALRAPARLVLTLQAGGAPWPTGVNGKAHASIAVCASCLEDASDALAQANMLTVKSVPATTFGPVRAGRIALARVLSVISGKLLEKEIES